MSKTVLISGASGGIGKAIAISFGRAGWQVALGYNTNEKDALFIRDILRENGIKSEIFKFDLCDIASLQTAVASVEKFFGGIDALINNAAIAHYGLFTDTTEANYRDVFDTNVGGTVFLTKEVLPLMLKKRCGSIVNISSVWGICGSSGEVLYSASKAAVVGFTKALAKEVGNSGIRVNCIAPGVIDTPMIDCLSEDDKKALIDKTPLSRLGTGQDVAEAALFLCSSSAEFITGQVLNTSGGFVI